MGLHATPPLNYTTEQLFCHFLIIKSQEIEK